MVGLSYRNRLKGKEGDRIKALQAASDYYMRKLLWTFFLSILGLLSLQAKALNHLWRHSEAMLNAA